MLFLLRNIRNQMIIQGKVWNYLLYAIGEIILVVVGILIAVQIDDWNVTNEKSKIELKILREIQVDLQNDLTEIREEIWNYDWIKRATFTLEEFYYSSDPFTDTLGSFIYAYETNPHFNPIDGGYQLLKSKGIDLITNDSLRLEINRYYEQSIAYYRKYESERIQMVLNEFAPFNNRHFYLSEVSYFPRWKRIPFDEQDLHENREWLSITRKSRSLANTLYGNGRNLEEAIMRLRKLIAEEINSKS